MSEASAIYTGPREMVFILGDDVTWTVTVEVDGVTTLVGWTIRLTFTSARTGTTFSKTESDTDWIDNSDAANLNFDILVDSTPTSVLEGPYTVKGAIEKGATRHYLGSAQWTFVTPPGGAYADL